MIVLRLSFADWLIVGAYFLLLLLLAARRKSEARGTAEEYILGGRLLTLPAFVAALVSTWYGGILGVGEFSYRYGISNWVVFGAPYYVFAVIFAFWFVPKVRRSDLLSIPEALGRAYGRSVALPGALLAWLITTPAPYILMLAVLLQVVTGMSFFQALAIGSAGSFVYAASGGFRSVVRTEKLQFALMFAGFMLMLGVLYARYGTAPFAAEDFPPILLTATGGNSWQYVVVWFFIALWTLVAPTFHQFAAAAKDVRTARNGILVSVLCWAFFDFLTTFTGLYARALIPHLDNPAMSYPALAERILPAGAKALFYLGMLATVMSTVEGFTFIAAGIAGRDMIAALARAPGEERISRYVQAGVALTILLSVAAILLFPSVISLWYVIGTVCIPGMLLPLIGALWERWRISTPLTLAAMGSGFLLSLLSLVWGQTHMSAGVAGYPFGIEPMYPGLAATILIYSAGLARRR